jgi:hypothetical protein
LSDPGDRIVIGGLAALVVAMAAVIGFEAWNRSRPAPAKPPIPAAAPAQADTIPRTKPAKPLHDGSPEMPTWEQNSG